MSESTSRAVQASLWCVLLRGLPVGEPTVRVAEGNMARVSARGPGVHMSEALREEGHRGQARREGEMAQVPTHPMPPGSSDVWADRGVRAFCVRTHASVVCAYACVHTYVNVCEYLVYVRVSMCVHPVGGCMCARVVCVCEHVDVHV